MLPKRFPYRVELKRNAALLRAEERAKRGDHGQILELGLRGHSHCREAEKLRIKVQNS